MAKFFVSISNVRSSNIIVLGFAQIMGMYFVSSVLLMRMNVPPEYRKILTRILGDLQFNFYHRWFDVIFLISAVTSIAVFSLIRKSGDTRFKHWYSSLSFLFFWGKLSCRYRLIRFSVTVVFQFCLCLGAHLNLVIYCEHSIQIFPLNCILGNLGEIKSLYITNSAWFFDCCEILFYCELFLCLLFRVYFDKPGKIT